MIECLQWALSLRRFDIQKVAMTISRFIAATLKDHLECLKRMYGFLKNIKAQQFKLELQEGAS
jgi:hypothetical protein